MFGPSMREFEKLSDEMFELHCDTLISIYGPSLDGYTRPKATISVADAVRKIAEHVGLTFEYVPGIPESVVLVEKPKLEK